MERHTRQTQADPREMPGPILYIAGVLPKLSETFVYREVFALRDRGVHVRVASVNPPETGLGDPRLEALAAEAVPVYGAGARRVLADAAREALNHPFRAVGTKLLALRDAIVSRDVKLARRPKLLWQGIAALALARRVRPLGIRHIHAHMAHVPTTIAMYAAHQLRIGFSFTGHANDIFPNRTLLAEKLRRARFASSISHWHQEFYRCVSGVPEARLPVVRCGVEVPPETGAAPRSTPLIVAVGRLMPKKGFDVLVRAAAELKAASIPCDCRIVGDGPQREELESLIREQNLTDRVTLTGAMPNDRVLAEIAAADLFVLPCRVDPGGDRDGIPVVLMEAMARGVCVISGDLPTIRELVRHGETGLMVPPGETAPLAAAIRTVLADPALRARLGRQGRAWVADEFSSAVNADRLIAAFTWALSSEKSPVCAA